MHINIQTLSNILADGGSKYAETQIDSIIVEPWNAISSLVLLIPGLIWMFTTKEKLKENLFLCVCFGLLFLGGLGSIFFHAFRSSAVLLQMDVMPMLLLTLCISWYFWKKIINKTWLLVLVLASGLMARLTLPYMGLFSVHTCGNISYFIGGLVLFLPAILFTRSFGFRKSMYLFLSVLFFIFALSFRELDTVSISHLPMGTHFLWHIFTAIGGYFLAEFVIKIERSLTAIPVVCESVEENPVA